MRPAGAPLALVDHQHAATVDLVLLAWAWLVHVDRVIDDPRVAGLVGCDAIVSGREPPLALEQHQAVRNAFRLLERLERPGRALRPRNHDSIFGVGAAAIVPR